MDIPINNGKVILSDGTTRHVLLVSFENKLNIDLFLNELESIVKSKIESVTSVT